MRLYDKGGIAHEIEEIRRGTHIELRFDEEFYCTCDNRIDVIEEIADMKIYLGLSECPA